MNIKLTVSMIFFLAAQAFSFNNQGSSALGDGMGSHFPAESAMQASIPFFIFALAVFSALKMKWIRLKKLKSK